jgi:DNA-binding transcriptional ArsR family regulator
MVKPLNPGGNRGDRMEQGHMVPSAGSATREQIETRSTVLKALAHPSRLMIVEELSFGERCVNDLTQLVGHDTSTVSKHLHLLKKSGIVEDDKRGKQVYYRLKVPRILNFFYCIDAVIIENNK